MTRLSCRQYPMLSAFAEKATDFAMPIDDARRFDQRPFRSMLIRKWVAYKRGRGFVITAEGREAWREFHATDIVRKNPALPLTSYFDPTAYGLRKPDGGRARETAARGAA